MRKALTRRDVIKGSTALGLTVFASPLKAAAPEPTAITPDLIEAANKEAKVILYSSMDLPVGEKLGKAFEAKYPGIAVQIERSGSERLFQAWLHTRETQQFFSDYTAQYSAHAQVVPKPGRRKLSDLKLMKEDAAGVEKMAEEIKTRYAKLFHV